MFRKTWSVLDRILSTTETVVILGLMGATLSVGFLQVVARWSGHAWTWADELVRYMVLWLGVIGAGPATRSHRHIAIDAFVNLLPAAPRAWIRRGTDLLAAGIVLMLVRGTLQYIEFVAGEQSATLGVEIGHLTWPVAAGFMWIGIRFLADAVFGADIEDHGTTPLGTSAPEAAAS